MALSDAHIPGQTSVRTVKRLAAELLVSERTVWRWIAEGSIECHRLGGQIRFTGDDVQAFLDRTAVPLASGAEAES
jgi:excisionase family DNA binding protein